MNTKEWEREFDDEFTVEGQWGERKFDFFRVENITRDSPIIRDDKVIEDLKNFIRTLLSSYTQEIREKVEKLLNDKRFPHQSLLFQGCPDCGQEINREWVDNKCKEIRDEALKDVLQILESKDGKSCAYCGRDVTGGY